MQLNEEQLAAVQHPLDAPDLSLDTAQPVADLVYDLFGQFHCRLLVVLLGSGYTGPTPSFQYNTYPRGCNPPVSGRS